MREHLQRYIERAGARSFDETTRIFRVIFDGLARAHAAGIVHGHLAPTRIAVDTSLGEPQVVAIEGFGGATFCSASWMAPEQARKDADVGAPADVWSLGLLAFYVLTGERYWKSASESNATLLAEVLFSPIVPATSRARELGVATRLPRGFDRWFACCVARDPKQRFADARTAAAAFARMGSDAKSGSGGGANAIVAAPRRVARARVRPPAWRSVLYALAAACGVVAPWVSLVSTAPRVAYAASGIVHALRAP